MNTRFALIASLALSGCIVTPRTTTHYDSGCAVAHKKVVLTAQQVDLMQGRNCGNYDCRGFLMSLLIVSPASAVISSSIAIVGNTMYWVEYKARCASVEQQLTSAEPTPGTLSPEI